MKEKNLKRSAHFISVLLNVGCIIFGVLSMALFIGIIAIVCTQLFFAGYVSGSVENCY